MPNVVWTHDRKIPIQKPEMAVCSSGLQVSGGNFQINRGMCFQEKHKADKRTGYAFDPLKEHFLRGMIIFQLDEG